MANGGIVPPSVQITGPADGTTLSATVTLFAEAASGQPIVNVTFFVDGTQIGQPVTAPPYMIPWDTTTADAGTHTLTATAIDAANQTASSAPITITVDNTHPPALIGKEATVFVDGAGTMVTPAFSTGTAGDLLVAFVGFDGPLSAAQRLGSCSEPDARQRAGARAPASRHFGRRHLLGAIDGGAGDCKHARRYPRHGAYGRPLELRCGRNRREPSIAGRRQPGSIGSRSTKTKLSRSTTSTRCSPANWKHFR